MSHDYYFYCVDCQSTGEMNNVRYVGDMRTLCDIGKDLGVLARAFLAVNDPKKSYPFELTYHGNALPLDWLAEHGDHRLKPVVDYGVVDGDCGKRVRCSCCEREDRCQLDEGHEGPCSRKKKT